MQVQKLEDLWHSDPEATVQDLERPAGEDELAPVSCGGGGCGVCVMMLLLRVRVVSFDVFCNVLCMCR